MEEEEESIMQNKNFFMMKLKSNIIRSYSCIQLTIFKKKADNNINVSLFRPRELAWAQQSLFLPTPSFIQAKWNFCF